MNSGNIGSDEFDTIFELFVSVLFMCFGIFAICMMIRVMNAKTEVILPKDKIEITASEHKANDPFYFTPYQAYMFGWVFDDSSEVPLTWLGAANSTVKYRVDDSYNILVDPDVLDQNESNKDLNYTIISSVDGNGNAIEGFATWKLQMISGSGNANNMAYYHNIRKTIKSVVSGPSNNLHKLYAGVYTPSGIASNECIMYHLEFTSKYNAQDENIKPLGVLLEKRRNNQWVLVPCLH